MTTRQGPTEPGEGLQTARAVARRVDKLEPAVREVERGLGALDNRVGQVQRGLTVLLQREAPDDAEAGKGQPDWRRCQDPDTARAMLKGARGWLEDAGSELLAGVLIGRCWPWHPRAVVMVLAAATADASAYAGESAVTVADTLTRHIPALMLKASGAIPDGCNGASHQLGEAAYTYDLDRLDDYAIWWATSREGLPPGLTPRVQAVR